VTFTRRQLGDVTDARYWVVSLCAHAAVLAALLIGVGKPVSAPAPAPAGPSFRMVAAPKAVAAAAPSIPEPPVVRKVEPPKPVAKLVLPAKARPQAQIAVAPVAQPAADSAAADIVAAPASTAGESGAGEALGGGDMKAVQQRPAYLSNPAPAYPLAAKRRGIEGRVLVQAELDEHGLPSTVRLARSSGSEMLDNSALEAVKGWRFSPAKLGGHPVRTRIVIPITFQMTGTVVSAIN
jgi:protein TonB